MKIDRMYLTFCHELELIFEVSGERIRFKAEQVSQLRKLLSLQKNDRDLTDEPGVTDEETTNTETDS